jgi:copper(I)-binding protein
MILMMFLRTAIVLTLLNLPIHAQGKIPSASDSSTAIVANGVAIYATLTNPTMYDAYVQSGTSESGKVELREGDKTTSNITIPAFGSVELTAGGPFVLVSELKGQPKAGDSVTVTLVTDGGDKIVVAATIK